MASLLTTKATYREKKKPEDIYPRLSGVLGFKNDAVVVLQEVPQRGMVIKSNPDIDLYVGETIHSTDYEFTPFYGSVTLTQD